MTGLVMEGGAMRGMFTAGVLDVFMAHGLTFDAAIGTSAGACFGCNIKSQQPGRAIRYNKRFCRDRRYCSLYSLLRTGDLYGADFCYHRIPEELDPFDTEAFRQSPMAFYVTATDVRTGQPVYHRCDTGDAADVQWMRASASMPIVSRPVRLDGRLLSDGGTADSIPLAYLERQGYARNVVILTQPLGYRKRVTAMTGAMRLALLRYPALGRALAARPAMYNAQLDYIAAQEKAGRCLVIRPPEPLNIHAPCHDANELERVYQLGRAEAERQLRQVCEFLDG